jgi:hypothetical protein
VQNLSSKCGFRENCLGESPLIAGRKGVRGHCASCRACLFSGLCDIQCKICIYTLVGHVEFLENRHREGRAAVVGVNGLTYTICPETVQQFESKERLGKLCVRRCGEGEL